MIKKAARVIVMISSVWLFASCDKNDARKKEVFDKGGVTFDFQEISDRRFGQTPGSGVAKNTSLMPVEATIMPMAFLDNVFCLSQNDPAIMMFSWKRNIPKEQFKLSSPVLCVELPEAVQIRGVGKNLKLISSDGKTIGGKAYKIHKIDMSSVRLRPLQTDGYDESRDYSMLLFANADAFTVLGDGSYQVMDGDTPVSEKKSFHLKVIPSIKMTGKKPSIFMNGFYVWNHMAYPGAENKELLGRFVRNAGTGIVAGYLDPMQAEVYRHDGIKTVLSVFPVRDGYYINPVPLKIEDKPEYARFQTIVKHASNHLKYGTCPVAVYQESEYFKKSVLPYLEEKLKGFDGLVVNWEPYHFAGKGCFCENCRAEFIKYSKIPEDEVKAAWPREMLGGKKYNKLWKKFRSFQHAEVVKTLNKAVDLFTSGKIGFVPEISWVTMADSKKGRDEFGAEYDPLDYAADLKYIDPWGPYPSWHSCKPYFYTRGANLKTFAIARKVREFADKNFPDTVRKPELIAFPTGYQPYGEQWVTQPEAISMDILSFFLNRYKSSALYHFPKGYDNRYWAAYAKTSGLIGEYEEYVFKGNRLDGIGLSPATPYPEPIFAGERRFLPDLPDMPTLQSVGYALGGKCMIAVGNFWEKGNVFFKLAVKGLGGDTGYIVTAPDKKCYFAGERNDFLSAAELEKGILLHAGALRWVFFVIEPHKENTDYGRRIMQSDVVAAMNECLPDITKAAEMEKKNDKKNVAENHKLELKALANGKLSCTPVAGPGGEQQLKFASGGNELLLGLNGMAVKEWKINKREWVASDGELGLGVPAFWEPVFFPLSSYQVKKIEPGGSGIIVFAEHQIRIQECQTLSGLLIRQRVEVGNDCSSLKIKTELVNNASAETGMEDLIAGFRYHNLPDCGSVIMKKQSEKVFFSRKYEKNMLFAVPGKEEAAMKMKKLFHIPDAPAAITETEAVFVSSNGKFSITMKTDPASLFAGFAVWDTPDQKAASFEPFFSPVTIKAQKSAAFSICWQAEEME